MKICLYCFDELIQGPNEDNHAFNKRKYCNKSHATLHCAERGIKNKTKTFYPSDMKGAQYGG